LKILIEVDHLQGVSTPYLQIKGTNKEIVTSAGSALCLDGSYTTKVRSGVLKSITVKHSHIYSLFLISSFMVPLCYPELSSNYFGELTS
jgi:hypothetical protein